MSLDHTLRIGTLVHAAVVAALASGCAAYNPPQAVKDSAVNTAQMVQQLDREVKEFSKGLEAVDAYFVDTMRQSDKTALFLRKALDERLSSAQASTAPELELFNRMKAAADRHERIQVDFIAAQAATDAKLKALLKPLPNLGPQYSAAAKELISMGERLPNRIALEEGLATLRAVRDNTRMNRDKLSKAATKDSTVP